MAPATRILLLTLVYVVAGKLGLRLAFVNASATAVWPPTGIALAAFLLLGVRVWPGIFIGAFLVNIFTAGTVWTSLGIAAGNTLEGIFCFYLTQRVARGRDAFSRPSDVFKFATVCAPLGTALGATIGVTVLWLGGFATSASYAPTWLTWWLGDLGGLFIIAPLLILWDAESRSPWSERKIVETALVVLSLGVVGAIVFGGLPARLSAHTPLQFLFTPIVLWAAFRLDREEAATTVFLLAFMAVAGTLRGKGPFYGGSLNDSLLLLQAYLAVMSVMSLTVSAVIYERARARENLEDQVQKRAEYLRASLTALQEQSDERERVETALEVSEARFDKLMEANVLGIIVTDGEGRIWEANEAFHKMVGSSHGEVHRGTLNALLLTPLEYRTQEAWALDQLRTRGSCPPLEKEFIHHEGHRVPVLLGGVQLEQAPERFVLFVIDVTHRRQAMEALRKAYDEIELRVDKRTKELSEANEELAKEVARRQKAEEGLRQLSLRDPLTGLYNRRGFQALAEQQWLQAVRDKREFFLFFADVDRLKMINDTLGHSQGDRALVEAADVLRDTFRKSDILARIGGDEFAVVAAQAPLDHAAVYMDRLQENLKKVNDSGRLPFQLSLSIGSATFDQKESTSVQELMRRADENLYEAKHKRTSPPSVEIKDRKQA